MTFHQTIKELNRAWDNLIMTMAKETGLIKFMDWLEEKLKSLLS